MGFTNYAAQLQTGDVAAAAEALTENPTLCPTPNTYDETITITQNWMLKNIPDIRLATQPVEPRSSGDAPKPSASHDPSTIMVSHPREISNSLETLLGNPPSVPTTHIPLTLPQNDQINIIR